MIETDILYVHPVGKQVYEYSRFFMFNDYLELEDHNSPKYYSYIPMGLIGTLNAVIEKGFSVRGVNLPFKKALVGYDIDYLKEFSHKIGVIDLHWYVHLKEGIEVAKFCKLHMPNVQVIVGGMTATTFSEQLIKFDCIDYVMLGDSEKPFSLLIENILSAKKNKVPNLVSKSGVNRIHYCTKDIDDYNYVDIGFMEDHDSFMRMFDFWLLVAKGCNYDCLLCDGSINVYPSIYSRSRLIVRDAFKVAKDIK